MGVPGTCIRSAAAAVWSCLAGRVAVSVVAAVSAVFQQQVPALADGHNQAEGGKEESCGESVCERAHMKLRSQK